MPSAETTAAIIAAIEAGAATAGVIGQQMGNNPGQTGKRMITLVIENNSNSVLEALTPQELHGGCYYDFDILPPSTRGEVVFASGGSTTGVEVIFPFRFIKYPFYTMASAKALPETTAEERKLKQLLIQNMQSKGDNFLYVNMGDTPLTDEGAITTHVDNPWNGHNKYGIGYNGDVKDPGTPHVGPTGRVQLPLMDHQELTWHGTAGNSASMSMTFTV